MEETPVTMVVAAVAVWAIAAAAQTNFKWIIGRIYKDYPVKIQQKLHLCYLLNKKGHLFVSP